MTQQEIKTMEGLLIDLHSQTKNGGRISLVSLIARHDLKNKNYITPALVDCNVVKREGAASGTCYTWVTAEPSKVIARRVLNKTSKLSANYWKNKNAKEVVVRKTTKVKTPKFTISILWGLLSYTKN